MHRVEAPPGRFASPFDLHRSRRLLFAVAVLLGIALTVTAVATYLQIRASLVNMAQSQGQRWLGDISRRVRPDSPPDEAALAEFLAEVRPSGLVCIAVFGRDLLLDIDLGDCPDLQTLRESVRSTPPGVAVAVGDRLRMVTAPPPPRPGRRRPEDERFGRDAPPEGNLPPLPRRRPQRETGAADDRPSWERHPPGREEPPPPRDGNGPARDGDFRPRAGEGYPGVGEGYPGDGDSRPRDGDFRPRDGEVPPRDRPPGPRPVVIEFVPLLTQRLQVTARRNVVVSLVAAAMLVVVAGAFSRFTVRAERWQEAQSRERHLAALGEMSAVLAHEIRNPLTSMKGHAQLLLEQLSDGAPGHSKAARVAREIERLERLVEDLLSYARSPQLTRRRVDPTSLLRDAANELGIQLAVDAARAPKLWTLDPDRMRQVIQNVLQNAQQVSPDQIEATVERVNDRLLFSVRDHGPGVSEGDEAKVFEPFHTTKVRGTGLGLAVAQRIVALHGGSIRVHNHAEGGAQFVIELPTAGEADGQDTDR